MTPLCFIIPTPPSLNGLFRNVVGRGRVRTKAYKAWADEAGWTIQQKAQVPPEPIKDRVAITLTVERKDARRRDIDNVPKAILDLLVDMAVIADDSQIQSLTVSWSEKSGNETLVEVRII